jgi:Ca2+-binding RTX toxin-like protein
MALFGYHLHHNIGDGSTNLITEASILQKLAVNGGRVARFDSNWGNYQTATPSPFNANSFTMSAAQYDAYLAVRNYDLQGPKTTLGWMYDSFVAADAKNVNVIFNFGEIPDWAQGSYGANSVLKPAYVGQFFADFIVYMARQKNGYDVLKNVSGWQMFNEVNNIYGNTAYNTADKTWIPYKNYFAIIESVITHVNQAYTKINWGTAAGTSGVAPPDVIGPALGGVYDKQFLNAMFDYHKGPENLALTSMSLHPYGNRVDAWRDADDASNPKVGYGTLGSDNLSYHRILMPTDDKLTWQAMAARSTTDSVYLYSSVGNPAEEWFDRNTELGVERTMALLQGNGFGHIKLNFTEWGASTYRGNPKGGTESLYNTNFADPFKYGSIQGAGATLSKAQAENLQAENIVQTIGLIENWTFVKGATIYETFDTAPDSAFGTAGDGPESHFGIAYNKLVGGNPNFKPGGHAYNAYMAGIEYHDTDIIHATKNIGVDIHIAKAGVNGTFNTAFRQQDHHEVILMREGNDTLKAMAGDDVVFGGLGDDVLTGDAGFDKLYGGAGNDNLNGGADADRLKGDAGNDILTGGTGKDQFVFSAYSGTGSGFAGSDTVTDFGTGGVADVLTIVGGYSAATLLGSSKLTQNVGSDVRIYYADNGASILLKGWQKAQLTASHFYVLEQDATVGFMPPVGKTINGTAGNDTINGTAAVDIINGLGGIDKISGGPGNDVITGGTGKDALSGGPGADRFVYKTLIERGDTIRDFSSIDSFAFKKAAFGNLKIGDLVSSMFRSQSSNVAKDSNDHFIYRTTDDTLWFDANGNKKGGLYLIADLEKNFKLTVDDIQIV